jgi:oligoendopeptidase F
LNYAGTLDNASTLAHELGHAVHSLLASKHTIMTQHAPIPLAETASIFAETIVVEELSKDPKRDEALLFGRLDDAYASAIRQIGFVLFEREAHKLIKDGASTDDLDNAYFESLKRQFGPHVEIDDSFKNEWYAIPHIFHWPFYCYGYSFGNLMAYAFYAKFRKEGAKAVPQILAFFEAGGSEAPIEIAKRVGVDITSEAFWQQGFDFIKSMVDRAEKLI